MRKVFGLIINFFILLFIIFFAVSEVNANWYAGSQKSGVLGVRAYIRSPSIITIFSEGLSNWVSSYQEDSGGISWIQAGWHYYSDFEWNPKQYVEYCKNYNSPNQIYYINDNFSSHLRGVYVHYQINKVNDNQWCAFTDGFQRICVTSLHSSPIIGMAKSEIHGSNFNSLDTLFNDVEFLDASNYTWRIMQPPIIWHKDFPYEVDIYSDSFFRTYRLDTFDIFLPTVQR